MSKTITNKPNFLPNILPVLVPPELCEPIVLMSIPKNILPTKTPFDIEPNKYPKIIEQITPKAINILNFSFCFTLKI